MFSVLFIAGPFLRKLASNSNNYSIGNHFFKVLVQIHYSLVLGSLGFFSTLICSKNRGIWACRSFSKCIYCRYHSHIFSKQPTLKSSFSCQLLAHVGTTPRAVLSLRPTFKNPDQEKSFSFASKGLWARSLHSK